MQQKTLVRAMRNKDQTDAEKAALESAKVNQAIADLSQRFAAKMVELTDKIQAVATGTATPDQVTALKSEIVTLTEKTRDLEIKIAGNLGGQNAPQNVVFDAEKLKAMASGASQSTYVVRTTEKALTNVPQTATAGNVTPAALVGNAPNAALAINLYDFLTKIPVTDTNAVAMLVETVFTNNSAGVAEGAQKPTSVITLQLQNWPVETIAHIMPVPLQMLADVPALQAYMASRMIYGLQLTREDKILNATGSSTAIGGILPAATAFTQGVLSALDTVLTMIGTVSSVGYTADAIVMNTLTRVQFQLEKDGNGMYLMGGPGVTSMPTLWGLPVIISEKAADNVVLVGAFKMAAVAHERQAINIAISTENNDNFEKNMATVRAETRLALSITRGAAFRKVTIDFTPA